MPTPRRSSRRPRAAPTATTSPTTIGCARSWAASRRSGAWSPLCRRAGWGCSPTSFPTTWASPRITTRGGSTCPRTAPRQRQKEEGRQKLVALLAASPAVRAFIEDNVRVFNGKPGDAPSMDQLDALLADQSYRAAYWRVAGEEINYRRFFDINELAAIRMEEPQVFEATHRLLFRLVREGAVTGLRIDHPDGLYDPADYFRRLPAGPGGQLYVA